MISSADQARAYEDIRDWIADRCGIHYSDEKRNLLVQRLSRVQRAFGLEGMDHLARLLLKEPSSDIELAVISAASTNHTYFYREAEVLNHVRERLLPQLANRDEIRIWSAACSTGDEVFTVAMLVAEALGDAALDRTTILGTDISAPVIERAELGIVNERQVAQLPADLKARYLIPAGLGQYKVDARIRSRCTFRRMNLRSAPYPFRNSFQIVFARNILYYFDSSGQAETLASIYSVTEPGGYLITSVTENIRDLGTQWRAEVNGVHRKDKS